MNVLLDTVNVKLNSDDHIYREYSKNDLQIIGKRKTMKSDQVDQELFEDELRELKELTKEKFDNSVTYNS
jgi:hypothetical protein